MPNSSRMPSSTLDQRQYAAAINSPHRTLPQSPYEHLDNGEHPSFTESPISPASAVSLLQPAVYSKPQPPPSSQLPPIPSTHDLRDTPRDTAPSSAHFSNDLVDPHDFYRQFKDPFARDRRSPSDSFAARKAELDEMATTRRAHTQNTKRPSKAATTGPFPTTRASSVPATSVSLTTSKSQPKLSVSSRLGTHQPSTKDLVNRFNQTTDEALPVPARSRVPSAGSLGSSRPSTKPYTKSRSTTPVRNNGGDHLREKPKTPKIERSRASNANNPWASHSMTNLHLSQNEAAMQPLFGEVIMKSTESSLPGFGIPARKRRGSDGAFQRESPALHHRSRSEFTISPPSPTDFYFGSPSTANPSQAGKEPDSGTRPSHRRTRSDFTGTPTLAADAIYLTPRTPNRPSDALISPTSSTSTTKTPQSRIPVRARRRTSISDWEPSSASSTRASFGTSSSVNTPASRRTQPAPPSLSVTSSATESLEPVTPRKISSRYEANSNRGTSPTLKAYISAPMPKKSPPLRSSRPRQPVSSATTSASRAKAVDRNHRSGSPIRHQRKLSEDKSRTKHIPELGGVDFAARRDQIQRAFTRSVRERTQKEEIEVERSRLNEERLRKNAATQEESNSIDPRHNRHVSLDGTNDEMGPRLLDDGNSELEAPHQTHQTGSSLTINTNTHPRLRDSPYIDSPTLGIPGSSLSPREPDITAATPEVIEPKSAFSPDSMNTPESGLLPEEPQLNGQSTQNHRTVLSQVMMMRAPSPALSSQTPFDESGSEHEGLGSGVPTSAKESVEHEQIYPPHVGSHARISDAEHRLSQWSGDSCSSHGRDYEQPERNTGYPDRMEDQSPSARTERGQFAESHSYRGRPSRSGRSTLDSETYSNINRALEEYHNPAFTNTESFHRFEEQLMIKTPELARQGGWDPKRVTQLYLKELNRQKADAQKASTQWSALQAKMDSRHRGPTSASRAQAPFTRGYSSSGSGGTDIESEAGEGIGENGQLYEFSEGGWSSKRQSANLDVPQETRPLNRASLQFAADWADASPSIVDWIHPQAADSPISESGYGYRPTPPPKDWKTSPLLRGPSTKSLPRMATPDHGLDTPQLPELDPSVDGLGLMGVHIDLPEGGSSANNRTAPPPLPNHSPPPPPIADSIDDTSQLHIPRPGQTPSPSIYSRNAPSTVFPAFPASTMNGVPGGKLDDASSKASINSRNPVPRRQSSSQPPHQPRVSVSESVRTSNEIRERSSSADKEQRRLVKRYHLIKELVDTEKAFYNDMKVTDEIYKGTTGACSGISQDDIKVLFGNVDQVVAFSQTFFDSLRRAASSVYQVKKITNLMDAKRDSATTSNSTGTEDRSSVHQPDLTDEDKDRKTFIGEAFGQHMSRLEKVYADFIKNNEAANKRLQQLQTQPNIALWLRECASHAEDLTGAWSLDSLLVKPMQRILKYPLILKSLVEVTPENHPDFTALDFAVREMDCVSMRIDEMMKRVDLVEQAIGRKRKESDVRTGFSKAFGRRTEKLRQQVGLSEMINDPEFNRVAEKWDSSYIQLQFALSDVERYLGEVQLFVERFGGYVASIEGFFDVGQTNYPELESKWRQFAMAVREITNIALVEHKAEVSKRVIDPMKTLVKLYDGPPKMIQKRNKRIVDYARYKSAKDRGDKVDKRVQEHGEQFIALNETLKDELPKLYGLTAKLAEACLRCFIQIQGEWQVLWQEKLRSILDDHQMPSALRDIMSEFSGDFQLTEAQVLSLGICNGSMAAETTNLLGRTRAPGEGASRKESTTSTRSRTLSLNANGNSPIIPAPDFSQRQSDGSSTFPSLYDSTLATSPSSGAFYGTPVSSKSRARAGSSQSHYGPTLPSDIPVSARAFYTMASASASQPGGAGSNFHARPGPSTQGTSGSMGRRRPSTDSTALARPASDATNFSYGATSQDLPIQRHGRRSPTSGASASGRPLSQGLFSSAMPMSESSRDSPHGSGSPAHTGPEDGRHPVMFAAASTEEFNIDRSRTEGGYPYLTYVKGEIFDVIAEKGELWLAKNQDDRWNTFGWLWCKHFVKLVVADQ